MHRDILPNVIFAPANLALDLCEGLQKEGAEATLFSPGPVDTSVRNVTADLTYFEEELAGRGDTYIDLLKKHAFTFVTLARQVQSELIAKAFDMANKGELDIVHIYTNEEDIALPFAKLCNKPVVFTHHDPFNFLVKYKNIFPKYKDLNWISMSYAQRKGMPDGTNWVGNVYHGIDEMLYAPVKKPSNDYVAYLGRIIEPKGVHLVIAAVKQHNRMAKKPINLKIAGKHYAGHKKDTYWLEKILPELDDPHIEYVGFINETSAKRDFLANAKALIVSSIFEEPFGMVMIEALACGTPVVGLNSGAIPEVIDDGTTGYIVQKATSENNKLDEVAAIAGIAEALDKIDVLERSRCRTAFENRFTSRQMCQEHKAIYDALITP